MNLNVQRVGPNVIRNEESVDLASDNDAASAPPKQYGMLKTSRLRRNKTKLNADPQMVRQGVAQIEEDAALRNFLHSNSNAEMQEVM